MIVALPPLTFRGRLEIHRILLLPHLDKAYFYRLKYIIIMIINPCDLLIDITSEGECKLEL